MNLSVLHVARAFSAQPTLGECLADAVVVEAPLAEALVGNALPDLIWVSSASPAVVDVVRRRFPSARILATPPCRADPQDVIQLIASGADLVLQDEGVVLASAGLRALSRRRPAAVALAS
ncbi:MAG TPA: hypothetical protein VHN80_15815 [Kineosporiaceae bacterium]|jgi:hypothetical protein|nr:hypothetical protein [Kineosporiaceae bacterium]